MTPQVIAERARLRGDDVFVQEIGGPTLTYRQFHDLTLRAASVLQDHGVGPGDVVVGAVEGAAAYWTWLGAAWLRAVYVPLNRELRGDLLRESLEVADPRAVIVEPDLVGSVSEALRELSPRPVVLVHGEREVDLPFGGHLLRPLLDRAELRSQPGPGPQDLHAGVFTSGTTGPSKCAVRSWAGLETSARTILPGDVDGVPGGAYYQPWPLFHGLALSGLAAAVVRDLRFVIRNGFSVQAFWDDVRQYNCTHAVLMVVTPFLLAQAAEPDDVENPLRFVTVTPLIRDHRVFEERFGVEVATTFGQTETGIVFAWPHPTDHGSVGFPIPEIETKIVGPGGEVVDTDETGELLVRERVPGQLADAYLSNPTAMAEKVDAEGWFHTGDRFRCNERGEYSFVDRIKDSIRHRGHNVSSYELEREILGHPSVAECACVGVASTLSDDVGLAADEEVKAVIVPLPGAAVTGEEIVRYLSRRVPRYMVPRYISIVAELPKTPTAKVRKGELRTPLAGEVVWDRLGCSTP